MSEIAENQEGPTEPTAFTPEEDGTRLFQLSIGYVCFMGEMKNSYLP